MVHAYKVHRWHEINKVATRTKLAGRITAQSLGNSRQLAITPETPLSRGRRRSRSIELREYSIPVSRQITVATCRVFVFYGKFMGNVKQNCLFINSARRSIFRRKFVLFSDDCHTVYGPRGCKEIVREICRESIDSFIGNLTVENYVEFIRYEKILGVILGVGKAIAIMFSNRFTYFVEKSNIISLHIASARQERIISLYEKLT